ncbi:MAG: ECF transporter S component [Malacoplasma sp.]|nr:ECF transporter S component [Malacoplasma sp.]
MVRDKQESSFVTKKPLSQKWKGFLFPLSPLRVFSNISSITIFAVLIALRMILQLTSIYIPVFSLSISVSWTPLIIIGWIYGPIFGLVAGVVTDTLGVLMSGSVWFWMYAIQEPIVGFLAGLFGYFCSIRMQSKKSNKAFDWLFFELIICIFSAVCVYVLIEETSKNVSFEGKSKLEDFFFKYSIWIILSCILFFFTFVQILMFVFWKKFRNNFVTCAWIVTLVCILSITISFLLGPISANEYYKYLYNQDSPYFVKYGIIFYLIPRAFKESIKAPLQATILLIVIPIANHYINEIKMHKVLKWTKVEKLKTNSY